MVSERELRRQIDGTGFAIDLVRSESQRLWMVAQDFVPTLATKRLVKWAKKTMDEFERLISELEVEETELKTLSMSIMKECEKDGK